MPKFWYSLASKLSFVYRSSHPKVFCQKIVLKHFSKFPGNTCVGVSFKQKLYCCSANLLKKVPAQLFYDAFCEFFQKAASYILSLKTASIQLFKMNNENTIMFKVNNKDNRTTTSELIVAFLLYASNTFSILMQWSHCTSLGHPALNKYALP